MDDEEKSKRIVAMARTLMSVCDGAHAKDKSGYNKPDSMVVRKILSWYPNIYFTAMERLRKTLIKYKRQLIGFGFEEDYNLLSKPLTATMENTGVKFEAEEGSNWIRIFTPYDRDFVREIRDVKSRRYNGDDRSNSVHSVDWPKIQELVKEHYQIELPVVGSGKAGEMRIEEDGILLHTDFYMEEIVGKVKQFARDHRKWKNETKDWILKPGNQKEIDLIKSIMETDLLDVYFSEEDLIGLASIMIDRRALMFDLSGAVAGAEVTPNLQLPLREYQKVAVRFAELAEGRALIADEMGCGKTVEALAFMADKPGRTAIVCPSAVKKNWEREIGRFVGDVSVQILKGRTDTVSGADYTIMNYAIAQNYQDDVFENLIVDESHYIKNQKRNRTKAVLALGKNAKNILCLTGTPLKNNRPIELWPTIQLLGKGAKFGGFWEYAEKYCNAYRDQYGWNMNGIGHERELHELLKKTMMVRRLKSQVLTELPAKQHTTLLVSDLDLTEYDEVANRFAEWIRKQGRKWPGNAKVVVQIEYLKQAIARAKMQHIKTWLSDFVETTDERILVFANHKEIQEEIYKTFEENAVWIKSGNDQTAIDEFKNGDAPICVISLMAGGIGLNLQEANNVLFVELGWTPDSHVQAEDRTHRIGQDKAVNVYTMLGDKTIDETIYQLIRTKEEGISNVLDEGEVTCTESVNIAMEIWKMFGGEAVDSTDDLSPQQKYAGGAHYSLDTRSEMFRNTKRGRIYYNVPTGVKTLLRGMHFSGRFTLFKVKDGFEIIRKENGEYKLLGKLPEFSMSEKPKRKLTDSLTEGERDEMHAFLSGFEIKGQVDLKKEWTEDDDEEFIKRVSDSNGNEQKKGGKNRVGNIDDSEIEW